MKLVTVTLLILSLILLSAPSLSTADFNRTAPPPPSPPSFCDSKCKARCQNAGVMDRCLKYCGICCQRCKCVPSATYGNKSQCPCYRDMKNSKGKSKCP